MFNRSHIMKSDMLQFRGSEKILDISSLSFLGAAIQCLHAVRTNIFIKYLRSLHHDSQFNLVN